MANHLQAQGDIQGQELRELVSEAQRGNRQAAHLLVERLLPRVRNLVRYLLRGDSVVDDVAQEALINIVRGLSGYRGDGAVTSWADRITARATFKWLRDARAQDFDLLEDVSLVPAPVVGPDELLQRRRLVLVLDRLPYGQRHALALHHIVGMTIEEVAEEMGACTETIRSRLRLGKERLKQLTQQQGLLKQSPTVRGGDKEKQA